MGAERTASAPTSLRYELEDAIATITLDRPEALNALTWGSSSSWRHSVRRTGPVFGRSC
jgi:enoyl-CoA hydratase/carnithine racemase